MPELLWDASALIKRYYVEIGSPTVNAIFANIATLNMTTTYLGYAEMAAILRRKFNQGVLNAGDFNTARSELSREVLNNPAFTLLSVDDMSVLSGIALTDRHNINSTDAAILATFLRHVRLSFPATAFALISADQRLLRAASAEGLSALNPETLSVADVPATLAAL